ncbi:MAG: UDP-N-acetylmuramoyl-L-alanyl-D-glutamate--2,6-diaminopimelate ligase [Clostridiales bacterium]|nr:UDP-N-acetylmuramoyl-L-alanyl-D-glutamate--2,6-diaminopimelate ligase [Clostridiales bacterium]MCF8021366.1 UDP-N-acetylmuramoyl-L-alanyl-D-glutamate--2,6-diaminopimelate ligase [Clostridiales bacterium]
MKLSQLMQDLKLLDSNLGLDVDIKGIAYDSRQVKDGCLFIAVEGFQTDGHIFIKDAVEKGASAVVIQKNVDIPENTSWARICNTREGLALISARFYNFPASRLKMIGVTGTNGKTTITHMINAVLKEAGTKTGLIGTIQNMVGQKVLPVQHTTPESADLQKLLNEMAAEDTRAVIMEVSSHALALKRVSGCSFDVGVFTNITQDHLDFHEDMQDYLSAKQKLFACSKISVINADSEYAAQIIDSCSNQVITYGIDSSADIIAEDIEITPHGVFFIIKSDRDSACVHLQMTGKFNVYNALAAFAAGKAEDIDFSVIKNALEKIQGVPGRFQLINRGQDFGIIIDYAHTPDGLQNIFYTAGEFVKGRLITVFGCGGDRDSTKRPVMGKIGAEFSDVLIVTSDNPRTEDPEKIISDVVEGIKEMGNANYIIITDRRSAINYAVDTAESGDVIIIAGKGHEDYQEINGQRFHFDDHEEVIKALNKTGGESS